MDSILTTIKKNLGITDEYTQFDPEIMMHINSVFMILTQQLGVGPEAGFRIADKGDSWSDFIPEDDLRFEAVKTYLYLKVKLMFDPPDRAAIMESYNSQIRELEWRLNVAAESSKSE